MLNGGCVHTVVSMPGAKVRPLRDVCAGAGDEEHHRIGVAGFATYVLADDTLAERCAAFAD